MKKFSTSQAREWRGFPEIPDSVYEVKKEFSDFNAREKFDIEIGESQAVVTGCICGPILRGVARPEECKLFKTECNPMNPVGLVWSVKKEHAILPTDMVHSIHLCEFN